MKLIAIKKRGFTLLEALISLGLLSFILGASFQAYYLASRHFLKIKEDEEIFLALRAALDKIKTEILEEGKYLETAFRLGLVKPFKIERTSFQLVRGEWWVKPSSDLVKGQTLLKISLPQKISPSRKVLIHDENKGEIKNLDKATGNIVIFTAPLLYSYEKEKTKIILLREIDVFFDSIHKKLRIKVNESPAQPLAEEIHSFNLSWKEAPPLLEVEIRSLKDTKNPLKQLIFLKNMALRLQILSKEQE